MHPQKKHDGRVITIRGCVPESVGEEFTGVYHHRERKEGFSFTP